MTPSGITYTPTLTTEQWRRLKEAYLIARDCVRIDDALTATDGALLNDEVKDIIDNQLSPLVIALRPLMEP